MATELKHTSLVQIESSLFRQGMNDGVLWYFHGDTPYRPVTEEDVMDFLQGNVVELVEVGFLDENRLRSTAGFLIGWSLRKRFHLPPAQKERFSRESRKEVGEPC